MAIYIQPKNKVKNIFINVNGEKKSVKSVWVNKDGVPTKVFQLNDETRTDPYEVAPVNEYMDWEYTIDDDNNVIILKYYIGVKTDVIVYANYIVNEKVYKTELASCPDTGSLERYMFNAEVAQSRNDRIETIKFSKNIDTKNVTSMRSMFYKCNNLINLDIRGFDTRNVNNMRYMFYQCHNLTYIDLSKFDTGNLIDMGCMFDDCYNLTSLDLSSFDTKNVTDMYRTFYNCRKLNAIYVTKEKWVTSQVKYNGDMFKNCGTSSVTYK